MKLFEDLKILEFSSVLAGPAVGMFFAELGARVIKIENKTTAGDVTRNWKLPSEDKNTPVSAYFSSVNWGKTHVFLNLKEEEDFNKTLDHIRSADIVLVNFKPGDAKKLNLDYESVRSVNTKVIYAQLSGFGQDDPRPAFDAILQAESGFMSMNGTKESGPLKMPVALIDLLAAHQLKEALLIALINKYKNGKGAFIDVSLYEAALSALANQASNYLMNGEIPSLMGSLHPNIAPYGETFPTADNKHIVLAVGTERQFKSLCEILEIPELAEKNEFSSNKNRVENRRELYQSLSPYFKNKDQNELLQKFHSRKVPAGGVKNLEEVFKDAKASKLILEEEVEGISTKRVKSTAFNIMFDE